MAFNYHVLSPKPSRLLDAALLWLRPLLDGRRSMAPPPGKTEWRMCDEPIERDLAKRMASSSLQFFIVVTAGALISCSPPVGHQAGEETSRQRAASSGAQKDAVPVFLQEPLSDFFETRERERRFCDGLVARLTENQPSPLEKAIRRASQNYWALARTTAGDFVAARVDWNRQG